MKRTLGILGFWTLGIFQDIENYDLQSSGTMFLRRLVAEKEPDVDDADEDNVALPGNGLRLRPNQPDLENRLSYDRRGHHHVEVGESGIFSLNIVFFSATLKLVMTNLMGLTMTDPDEAAESERRL